MRRRTIAAILLAALSSPALAFTSTTYDQAANMAAGKTPANAAYDGNAARASMPAPGVGAPTANVPAAADPYAPAVLAPLLPAAATLRVPAPESERSNQAPVDRSRRALLYGTGGAALGAMAGFGIGVLLSKILR